MAQESLFSQGLLIIEASRSHSDTPQSACLPRTRDQPVAETNTWHTQHSQENINAHGGIQTHHSSKWAATDRTNTGIGTS